MSSRAGMTGVAVLIPALCGGAWGTPGAVPDRAGAWTGDIHDPTDGPVGDGPAALSIVAARNGSFSAKVVVAGAAPKAEMSDLKQAAAAGRRVVQMFIPPTAWKGSVA